MPNTAQTSTATPQGVAVALARLAVAYFYLLNAGDWARASVVLSVFAETFNAQRDLLIAFIQSNSGEPTSAVRMVPQGASTTFTSTGSGYDTRRSLQVALLVGLQPDSRLVPIIDAMPEVATPTVIQPWWARLAGFLADTVIAVGRDAQADSMSVLANNLRARTDAFMAGGLSYTRQQEGGIVDFDSPTPSNPDAPGPGGTGPTIVVHAPTSGFHMPTWGWWAIGAGLLAATGVITYGVVEKGWFR